MALRIQTDMLQFTCDKRGRFLPREDRPTVCRCRYVLNERPSKFLKDCFSFHISNMRLNTK